MSLHTLMFGWEYPPLHSGGLGVACQGIVRGLLRCGVRVTLVLPQDGAEGEDDLSILSPTDEHLSLVKIRSSLHPYETPEQYATRLLRSPAGQQGELYGENLGDAVERFTAMSVAMTKDTDPSIVHCHDWMTYEAGIRAADYHGTPLVAHVHATEFDRTDFHPNEWIAQRERRGLFAADRVIAVSHYTKNILTTHYGIPAERIAVVHNAHEPPAAVGSDTLQSTFCGNPAIGGKRDHPPLVLFLGRLTIQKNPWQFLEVARVIHALRPEVQFVVAGDGPLLPELLDRACELGLANIIVFTGRIRCDEVDALYRRADCFVMPSLSEPFGLVALEAIAHGTPVVLSKQSGVIEVLPHCFKIDFWDTEKMADCILTILREEPLALQLRSEAPRILQRLTWQAQAGIVRSLYENLLSLAPRSSA